MCYIYVYLHDMAFNRQDCGYPGLGGQQPPDASPSGAANRAGTATRVVVRMAYILGVH